VIGIRGSDANQVQLSRKGCVLEDPSELLFEHHAGIRIVRPHEL
jgi:hypothetical protein